MAQPSNDPLSEIRRLYSAKRFAAVEEGLKRLLESEPGNPPARVFLGVLYAKTKRYADAEAILEPLLGEYPEQFDSLVWLANVRLAQKRFEPAVALCEQAIAVAPTSPAAHNALGLCRLSMRQSDAALQSFRRAVELEPRSGASYHNLGLALRLRDEAYDACRAFAKAVELAPNEERNYLELFRQQQVISAWHDAILNLQAGHKRFPNSVAIAESLGLAYVRVNDKARGEQLFKRVWKMQPGVCKSYAIWLQEEGRFEESVAMLKESLEIEPVQGSAYYCLSEAKAFDLGDGTLIEKAKTIEDDPKLNATGRMYLAYALGKAYETAKDYESAIRYFDQANEIAFETFNAGRRLDYDVARSNTERLKQMYSPEAIEDLKRCGSSSETPIFIVGMIRSGTTLLDQILSSHPQIATAGEQPFWKLEGGRLTTRWNLLGEIRPGEISEIRESYLEVLRNFAGDSPRITDKMPLNYEFLGLIHGAFPKAKILHIRRNPVDTCLSIYMTHFGGGPNFAYKQENIVCHYREYLSLMEHWRAVLPEESFFELDYEELVADKERVTREAIDFCGLPWDDACLRHDENPSAVSTPSRWQARQPIYNSSVERWRRYEPWLGALLDLKNVSHPMICRRERARRGDAC